MKQTETVRVWLNASEYGLHDDPNAQSGFAFSETTNELVIASANVCTIRWSRDSNALNWPRIRPLAFSLIHFYFGGNSSAR